MHVKQRLYVEREDRFGHLLDCARDGTRHSRDAIGELLVRNNIVPDDFVRDLEKVLNWEEEKITACSSLDLPTPERVS